MRNNPSYWNRPWIGRWQKGPPPGQSQLPSARPPGGIARESGPDFPLNISWSWFGGDERQPANFQAECQLLSPVVVGGQFNGTELKRHRTVFDFIKETAQGADIAQGFHTAIEGGIVGLVILPLRSDAIDGDAAIAGPIAKGLEHLLFRLGRIVGQGVFAHPRPFVVQDGFAPEQGFTLTDLLA